jgi:hypothetical protein
MNRPVTHQLGATPYKQERLGEEKNSISLQIDARNHHRTEAIRVENIRRNNCLSRKATPRKNLDETRNIGYITAPSVQTF